MSVENENNIWFYKLTSGPEFEGAFLRVSRKRTLSDGDGGRGLTIGIA